MPALSPPVSKAAADEAPTPYVWALDESWNSNAAAAVAPGTADVVVADGAGRVFVLDKTLRRVVVLDKNGDKVREWVVSDDTWTLRDIASDGDGVWLLRYKNAVCKAVRYDAAGSQIREFSVEYHSFGFVAAPDGTLWTISSLPWGSLAGMVYAYDSAGVQVAVCSAPTFDAVHDIAVDEEGDLYFVDKSLLVRCRFNPVTEQLDKVFPSINGYAGSGISVGNGTIIGTPSDYYPSLPTGISMFQQSDGDYTGIVGCEVLVDPGAVDFDSTGGLVVIERNTDEVLRLKKVPIPNPRRLTLRHFIQLGEHCLAWSGWNREQQAYQLQVWSGPDRSGMLMWDSGETSSTAADALYDGPMPETQVRYYARVRLSDGQSWSDWDDCADCDLDLPFDVHPVSPYGSDGSPTIKKTQIHAHSVGDKIGTIRGPSISPEQLRASYERLGYDCLFITNHRLWDSTTRSEEITTKHHILTMNTDSSDSLDPPYSVPVEDLLGQTRGATGDGWFNVAHPNCSVGKWETNELLGLQSGEGIGVYNESTAHPGNFPVNLAQGYADGSHGSFNVLDYLLLNRKYIWTSVEDDYHPGYYWCFADTANMVYSDSDSPSALSDAMRSGRFYSSRWEGEVIGDDGPMRVDFTCDWPYVGFNILDLGGGANWTAVWQNPKTKRAEVLDQGYSDGAQVRIADVTEVGYVRFKLTRGLSEVWSQPIRWDPLSGQLAPNSQMAFSSNSATELSMLSTPTTLAVGDTALIIDTSSTTETVGLRAVSVDESSAVQYPDRGALTGLFEVFPDYAQFSEVATLSAAFSRELTAAYPESAITWMRLQPDMQTWLPIDTSVEGTSAVANVTLGGYYTLSTMEPRDVSAPVVSITAPQQGATLVGTVTVSAEATDDVGIASADFWLGDTCLGTDSTPLDGLSVEFSAASFTPGARALAACAHDAHGRSTTVTVNVTVDSEKDSPQIAVSAPSNGIIGSGQSMTGSASGLSLVALCSEGQTIAGNNVAPDGTFSIGPFDGMTSGVYPVELIGSDSFECFTKSLGMVTFDMDAPSTTATCTAEGLVSLTATDALSGVASTHYALGGGDEMLYTGSFEVPQQEAELRYWSVDQAGNVESESSMDLFPDITPPVVSISTTPQSPDGLVSWFVSNPTVALSADESATLLYSWDGSAEVTYTAPLTAPTGVHSLWAWGVDEEGNSSQAIVASFFVDPNVPTTTSDVKTSYIRRATIALSATDTVSGVGSTRWTLDSMLGSGMSASTTALGSHTLRFASNDVAGNAEATKTVQFVVNPAPITRAYGADRYATSVEISKKHFTSADTVVIACGDSFPDALSASSLAGAVDGPLLLTAATSLPTTVRTEMLRLGASKAYIIGSTAVISDTVKAAIVSAGLSTERIGGVDRYDTAAKVAYEVKAEMGTSFPAKAFVVVGTDYPDGLCASAYGASQGFPVLLTRTDLLPTYTSSALNGMDISYACIVGSTTVVSSAVENSIRGIVPTVERVSGSDRYDTSSALATKALQKGWATPDYLGVATGENFPDALAGGPAAGSRDGVVLLTKTATLSPSVTSYVDSNLYNIYGTWIYGSTTAVSQADETSLAALLSQ